MSVADGEISPVGPVGGYAPEPSGIARDRDVDGALLPQSRKKRKKKKKQKPPAPNEDAPSESDPGHRIDIRVEAYQIEMALRNDPEELAAQPIEST